MNEAHAGRMLADGAQIIRVTLAAEHPRKKLVPEPVRASVHLFDQEDWRDIAAVEWTPQRRAEFAHAEIRRSSTLWRLIREFASPVAIVALTRRAFVYRSGRVETFEAKDLEEIAPQATMLKGAATHALAVPIRAGDGTPIGMLAIEMRSRSVVEEFDWNSCFQRLQKLVDDATKALLDERTDSGPGPETLHLDLITCFAQLNDHVLIKGPTGVGKTYLAREIHARSGRSGPLIVYSAQAFPDDLQTAYLLGWKKGAFNGAYADKSGAIEEAANGTLFVDEVDKLSLPSQRALLLLTDKHPSYTPLGSNEARAIPNVRFIFASNIDLKTAYAERLFLHDLYFRINEFPISIPSLAERRAEIPHWCRLLTQQIHQDRYPAKHPAHDAICAIDSDAINLIAQLEWPGNLRQLNSILKRAYALATMAAEAPARLTLANVASALALDGSPPVNDVLTRLEALANAAVQQTRQELQTWTPEDPTRDEDNPGLANYLRTHDVLFPLVWQAAERALGESKRKEVARLVGKSRALAGKNYAQERTAAFKKVEELKERLRGHSKGRGDQPPGT